MSKTSMALVVKFIMTFIFAWLTLGLINGNTLGNIFVVSLLGTVLNYILGDLLVLPSFGNIVASLGDGVLGALTAWVYGILTPMFRTSWGSLIIFAVLIAVGEYFFHIYLKRSDKVAP